MGNRKTSTSGTGAGVSSRAYGRNALNQYTSLTHDGKVNVLGRADIALTDTSTGVNPNGIDTQGNLYGVRHTATGYATDGKLVTTTLKRSGTTGDFAPQSLLTWAPPANFVPIYNADGNLTYDGSWTYTWNAENRLIQMETTTAATTAATTAGHPYTKLKFVYDWQGKRIARAVWQGGTQASPTFKSNRRWLYDGWNVVAEFSAMTETITSVTRLNTFTWGLDLSGTLQGAGGVGGLLVQTAVSGGVIEHASYDGNGNIVAWTKSTASAPTSRREYDAFGNTLVNEGLTPCSFGFSAKMQDGETGLYYYGYRYYGAANGRWLGRDPLGENGGENLFGFINNEPVSLFDLLGLWTVKEVCKILCCEEDFKSVVESLAKATVKSFDSVKEKRENEDGREVLNDGKGYLGFQYGDSVYAKKSMSNEEAATTFVHEITHLHQPKEESLLEGEVDAYNAESEFKKQKKYPISPEFLDESGTISRNKIRNWLKNAPPYNQKSKFVGLEFSGEQQETGWVCGGSSN